MDTVNSNPQGTGSAPSVDSTPSAEPLSSPKGSPATPAIAPAPAAAAPAPVFNGELPKTTGKTPGGWNRFAGYDPNAAKNKQRNDRGGKGGRR